MKKSLKICFNLKIKRKIHINFDAFFNLKNLNKFFDDYDTLGYKDIRTIYGRCDTVPIVVLRTKKMYSFEYKKFAESTCAVFSPIGFYFFGTFCVCSVFLIL